MAKQRGVTLIEILLALIVMILGLVGILALFPVALQASKESFEDTHSAIMAESVASGLRTSIRFAQASADGTYKATLLHDLKEGAAKAAYEFTLPKLTDGSGAWFWYPGQTQQPFGAPLAPDSASLAVFQFGGDDWIHSAVQTVHDSNDLSDPYRQFGFSFRVRKVNTLQHKLNETNPATGNNWTLAELEPLVKLYEFEIFVFRIFVVSSGGGTGTSSSGQTQRELKARVSNQVSLK